MQLEIQKFNKNVNKKSFRMTKNNIPKSTAIAVGDDN